MSSKKSTKETLGKQNQTSFAPYLLTLSLLLSTLQAQTTNESDYFITTWEISVPGDSIIIPTTGDGYNYTVDWGDGTVETNQTGNATHIYAGADVYTVRISGDFPRIYFRGVDRKMRAKILTIEQWGSIQWASMAYAFYSCLNLNITNSDIDKPDLTNVTDMSDMFFAATSFDGYIGHWDVSNVENMSYMLARTSFNQDIGDWDVGNVTNMAFQFMLAFAFNQDIGSWNVGNVLDMTSMLSYTNLSTENYDALLLGWSIQNLPVNMNFHMYNSKYCAGAEARELIISNFNWNFIDGGPAPNCPPNALCQDITVALDNNGLVSITPEQVDMGSNSLFGDVELSLDISNFTCSELGYNPVILTAKDANNRSSTCTAIITVNTLQNLEVSVGSDQLLCDAVSQPLGGNNPLVGIGVWTGPDGVTFSPNANDPNAIAENLPAGISTLTWTISGDICESTTTSASVQITRIPIHRHLKLPMLETFPEAS